jgi:hypothetical protein
MCAALSSAKPQTSQVGIHGFLPMQINLTLNSPLRQKPNEKLNSGRRRVLPNKRGL